VWHSLLSGRDANTFALSKRSKAKVAKPPQQAKAQRKSKSSASAAVKSGRSAAAKPNDKGKTNAKGDTGNATTTRHPRQSKSSIPADVRRYLDLSADEADAASQSANE
jgi:hypothetical protein